MDDTHNTTDPSQAPQSNRLGRGLSSLLSTPASSATPSTPSQAGTTSPSLSADVVEDAVEDAVALFAGYDERLSALTDQLDAACHLLNDTRTREVASIQKQAKLAWSIAASLAIATLIGCFWAGATTASSRTELSKVQDKATVLTADVTALTDSVRTLASRSTDLQLELDITRAALLRANTAIDELVEENAANLSATSSITPDDRAADQSAKATTRLSRIH